MNLSGRTALVTGATQGIGLGIAKKLVDYGADVWVHGISERSSEAAASKIGARKALYADFNSVEETDAMIGNLIRQGLPIDILVNNAGIEHPERVSSLSRKNLSETMLINAMIPALLTRELLPLLKNSDTGASVVNITSIHQQVPYPGNSAYCMSKAALDMFTKTSSVELASFGIRVNNVAPGAVETEINRDVIESIGRNRFKEWIPQRDLGSSDNVADSVVFLCSSLSQYVTGTTIYVDGAYRHNLLRYRLSEGEP